jgi:hypothetical protein
LSLSGELREAYNTSIFHVWYLSIDRRFILLSAEFEDGSYISVLKNRATYHKHSHLETKEFLKRQKSSKTAHPLNFTPRLLPSRLGVPMHIRVFKMAGTYLKESSLEDGFK